MLSEVELSDVRSLVDRGDVFLNEGGFAKALVLFREALAIIPEPKVEHPVSLMVWSAIGEALFYSGSFVEALTALRAAAKCLGGIENPLVHLRMGQSYFEIGEMHRAADSLTKAYMLDGSRIFEGEDQKYFTFLTGQIQL